MTDEKDEKAKIKKHELRPGWQDRVVEKSNSPRRFRKIAKEITAEQWDGWSNTMTGICRCGLNPRPHVHTMHENQLVVLEKGDWIVPEPDGVHFYPVKPDVFAATYEEI